VLVLTTEDANGYGLPVVVPITTTRKPWPTRIELAGPLPQVSFAQCEQIRAVSARRLGRLLGQADPVAMARISLVLRRLLQL
jgi:mRNA interferase MazF